MPILSPKRVSSSAVCKYLPLITSARSLLHRHVCKQMILSPKNERVYFYLLCAAVVNHTDHACIKSFGAPTYPHAEVNNVSTGVCIYMVQNTGAAARSELDCRWPFWKKEKLDCGHSTY
jgi:hypothetical protein